MTNRLSNEARIEVRIDTRNMMFAVLLDGEVVKQSDRYADVRTARFDIEWDIYEATGAFPVVWLPFGRFSADGEWITRNRS